MSDEEMLKGCKAHQEKAQKYLFDRYSRIMTGVCMRYADSYEEAQDIVQDGFIKVFKKIGLFSGTGSLEGWIRRIIVNTALDSIRKNKKLLKVKAKSLYTRVLRKILVYKRLINYTLIAMVKVRES